MVNSIDYTNAFKAYEQLVVAQKRKEEHNNKELLKIAQKDAEHRRPLHEDFEHEIMQFEVQTSAASVFYPTTLNYERRLFIGNLLFKLKSPSAVIQPHNVEHVKQAIILTKKLAKRANIMGISTPSFIMPRLTVKGGGHSYAGYCVNQNGIVLDMQQMNKIEIVSNGKELRIGAGCVWKDVYDHLERYAPNKLVIGGLCPSVGVAGFTLGGGISPFSRIYGLGIDNVTEITVVTANGQTLTLDRAKPRTSEEGELFWALCGGGGGNFGVVTEFKTTLHDFPGDICFGPLTWYLDDSNERALFLNMMEAYNKHYSDDGNVWSRQLTLDAIWHYDRHTKELVGQLTVIYNGNKEECWKALSPLHEFIINDTRHNNVTQMPWRKLVVIEEGFDIKTQVYHFHSSFILEKGQITRELVEKMTSLLELTREVTGDTRCHILWSEMGGKVSEYASDATPFPWRNGVYPINFKLKWSDPKIRPAIERLIHVAKFLLQPHAIEKSAAYLNYIDRTLGNWQYAYYGQNYDRLKRVKLQWDPENFFEFEQSIEREGHERAQVPAKPLLPDALLKEIEAEMKVNVDEAVKHLYASVSDAMTCGMDLEGMKLVQDEKEKASATTGNKLPDLCEKSIAQWNELSWSNLCVLAIAHFLMRCIGFLRKPLLKLGIFR